MPHYNNTEETKIETVWKLSEVKRKYVVSKQEKNPLDFSLTFSIWENTFSD